MKTVFAIKFTIIYIIANNDDGYNKYNSITKAIQGR